MSLLDKLLRRAGPPLQRPEEQEVAGADERAHLIEQRNALVAERDELLGHARRLAAELDSANEGRRLLAAERDELKSHAERLAGKAEEAIRKFGVREAQLAMCWVEPGHFYSPIVDPADMHARRMCTELRNECPPGIAIDEGKMLGLLQQLSVHYASVPFPQKKTGGWRYWFDNPHFTYADAIVLFCLLRELRPKRVVEIGCGFSSCVSMDTNDHFLEQSMALTFIDPNPESLEELLDASDPYRSCISRACLQDVPADVFDSLAENDILFLDSSHVGKAGSDVNDYCTRILPRLQPGVIVHVHDVFWPFEYPAAWASRSWNEAYILRAFLQYNREFEILLFNDYLHRRHKDVLEQCMPLCARQAGGSIWLRRTLRRDR